MDQRLFTKNFALLVLGQLGKLLCVLGPNRAVAPSLFDQFQPQRGQYASVCLHRRRQNPRILQDGDRLRAQRLPLFVGPVQSEHFPDLLQSVQIRTSPDRLKRILFQKQLVAQRMHGLLFALEKPVKHPLGSACQLHDIRNGGLLITF